MKKKQASRDIFVAELSFETTEEQLRQLFSLCGTVRMLKLLDDEQGNFKGLAFVRMNDDKENRAAVNMLDGTLFNERIIKVSIARTAEERAADMEARQGATRRKGPRRVLGKGKPGR